MNRIDLTGKVAVITGTTRGIGRCIALELARAGANIVMAARTVAANPHHVLPGTLEQTEAEVRACGVEVLSVATDVAVEADVLALRDQALARFGRCDILVNNSAVSYLGPLLDLTVKRWDILFGVNLRGPMMLSQAFLPGMLERGSGSIINITSASGRSLQRAELSDEEKAIPLTAYGTSKAALNQLTILLDRELSGRGVAINALEVHAATEIYLMNVREPDFTQVELPDAPAQLVAWIAAQPASFTGQILDQTELLRELRAQGVVRAMGDPQKVLGRG